jgi:GntR family transcriptional regulator
MNPLSQFLKPLDPDQSQPLYQQVQRVLREAIQQRALGPDDALPAERDLATELQVSRITIRKALDGLVKEGLVVSRRGSGNFVAGRVEKNFAMLSSFSEDMRARGRTPRSTWLKRSEGTVTPEEGAGAEAQPGHAGVPLPSPALRRQRADVGGIRHHRGVGPA